MVLNLSGLIVGVFVVTGSPFSSCGRSPGNRKDPKRRPIRSSRTGTREWTRGIYR